jgi:hypothetical protein
LANDIKAEASRASTTPLTINDRAGGRRAPRRYQQRPDQKTSFKNQLPGGSR